MGSSKRPSPPPGARSQVAHVAEIPANLEKVFVRLEASGDLDLRLLDALSGEVLLDFAERVNWCCFKPTTYTGSGAEWKASRAGVHFGHAGGAMSIFACGVATFLARASLPRGWETPSGAPAAAAHLSLSLPLLLQGASTCAPRT